MCTDRFKALYKDLSLGFNVPGICYLAENIEEDKVVWVVKGSTNLSPKALSSNPQAQSKRVSDAVLHP